jgi:two-component system KDP operon response regulator KdpE
MKVLIIEKDRQVVNNIAFCLAVRYPDVVTVSASRWQQGIEMIETELPDLIIISSSPPDIDTTGIIREIRRSFDIPLLTLIEGESDIERAMALEAGADDYLPRPFSPIELVARVTALFRRTYGLGYKHDHTFSAGELTINFSTHNVSLSGRPVRLTPHEYGLLSELAQNEGHVLPHSLLLEKVWGAEYTGDHAFIKKYIYRLRSKLETDPENPRMLLSERGVGYRFVRPVA